MVDKGIDEAHEYALRWLPETEQSWTRRLVIHCWLPWAIILQRSLRAFGMSIAWAQCKRRRSRWLRVMSMSVSRVISLRCHTSDRKSSVITITVFKAVLRAQCTVLSSDILDRASWWKQAQLKPKGADSSFSVTLESLARSLEWQMNTTWNLKRAGRGGAKAW